MNESSLAWGAAAWRGAAVHGIAARCTTILVKAQGLSQSSVTVQYTLEITTLTPEMQTEIRDRWWNVASYVGAVPPPRNAPKSQTGLSMSGIGGDLMFQ
ncbi:hypothetical protein J6590_012194 [Homalodisca vitripennis]|nr:hypothetical protein J6590_012194 [Homalodisca vitripennis]